MADNLALFCVSADTRRTAAAGGEEAPSDRRTEASVKGVSEILIEQLQKDKVQVCTARLYYSLAPAPGAV